MAARPERGPAPRSARSLSRGFDFGGIREEFEVPLDFSAEALAEARAAAQRPAPVDVEPLEFVTLDPPGSRDLDQAVHLARWGAGFRVSYAIADVSSFVTPGGALDAATAARGVTVYCPDLRVPLHPVELSEGAASLLADQNRPAVLWEIDLDGTGEVQAVSVRRTAVRSVAQLAYPDVQADVDAGRAHPSLALLPEIGRLRQRIARARHAIELRLPEQEVVDGPGGGWSLDFRAPLPVEAWNAEISLVTGMAAARLMLEAGIGVLRTLPAAPASAVRRLRRLAPSLGVDWPEGAAVGDVLADLDIEDPRHLAFQNEAAGLLRGAGYTAFTEGRPAEPVEHAGVAAAYAHVTAPLRRLVDRFGTEVCLAVAAGTPVPDWVGQRLPDLPGQMAATDRRAAAVERACVDLVEAELLAGRIGEEFTAVVTDVEDDRMTVVLDDPAVRAPCDRLPVDLGAEVRVRLREVDVAARRVRFGAAG